MLIAPRLVKIILPLSVNPTCFSVLGEYKLYNLINNMINEETFKSDFNNVTKPLLYDSTQYSECLESLKAIQKFLKQNNL